MKEAKSVNLRIMFERLMLKKENGSLKGVYAPGVEGSKTVKEIFWHEFGIQNWKVLYLNE